MRLSRQTTLDHFTSWALSCAFTRNVCHVENIFLAVKGVGPKLVPTTCRCCTHGWYCCPHSKVASTSDANTTTAISLHFVFGRQPLCGSASTTIPKTNSDFKYRRRLNWGCSPGDTPAGCARGPDSAGGAAPRLGPTAGRQTFTPIATCLGRIYQCSASTTTARGVENYLWWWWW
jgi:hypothetical protein